MSKVAIIILNWNGLKYLTNCLECVYKQTYKKFEVYFVDNASTDGSVDYVRANFPNVYIVGLKKNEGFAKGMNEGIREALKDPEVEHIVCLNNDTLVANAWLVELVKTAESSPKIGGVSSKAYFDDEKTIQNAGLEFSKALQINKPGGLSIGFGRTDKLAPGLSEDIEVFAPGGVASLYKREVVVKLLERDGEFFDEDFFAYGEDYDVGFRIRSLGYSCKLSSRAILIHLHSKTGGVASPFKAFYVERNGILAAIKNLPLNDILLFPLRSFLIKLMLLESKNNSVNNLKSNVGVLGMIKIVLRANISALFLVPKMILKRWKAKL